MKATRSTIIREAILERLSQPSSQLDLDERIDEAPEDIYESLGNSDKKSEIDAAVDSLVTDVFKNPQDIGLPAAKRFLSRALRLCDALQIERSRSTLKLILLSEDYEVWGLFLDDLYELAARALLSLPVRQEDARFWSDAATRSRRALPYSLRASIEIDLRQGLLLFWRSYLSTNQAESVDWAGILDELDENVPTEQVQRQLEETFYEALGKRDAFVFEVVVRRHFGLVRFSRAGERLLSELGFEYGLSPSAKPIAKGTAGNPILTKLFEQYDPSQRETVLSADFAIDRQAYAQTTSTGWRNIAYLPNAYGKS